MLKFQSTRLCRGKLHRERSKKKPPEPNKMRNHTQQPEWDGAHTRAHKPVTFFFNVNHLLSTVFAPEKRAHKHSLSKSKLSIHDVQFINWIYTHAFQWERNTKSNMFNRSSGRFRIWNVSKSVSKNRFDELVLEKWERPREREYNMRVWVYTMYDVAILALESEMANDDDDEYT